MAIPSLLSNSHDAHGLKLFLRPFHVLMTGYDKNSFTLNLLFISEQANMKGAQNNHLIIAFIYSFYYHHGVAISGKEKMINRG